ncbi:MAG: FkbM family methyltransferase [Bacteroidota bacterium]
MKITQQGFAVLENDTHIGKWVEENKRLDFDQNAQPRINSYLKKGDVIIDAGANIGCYSYGFMSVIGDSGFIHAFEPSAKTFDCLVHNMSQFKNVHLYSYALGKKSGYVKVVEENDNVGMNFCENTDRVNADCKVITIDSLNLNKCDFIKIDVEGFELDVLIGASQTIDTFKPKMYIEINSHTLKRAGINSGHIFDWLNIHGYTYKNIYPGQGLTDDQFDIIATPK